ncbi:bidirectional sugar transporter SWEET6b-like [Chenopodium quinoa]|uniref:bidirectional sugar transporter SWEET6b-like n=1 Tax=Chenopodium quinoa TaxID=63459 RepID=UPI000B78CFFF|nr:bidirectional sugar transporter SWEET6b-like [Chenopodium quinoa]
MVNVNGVHTILGIIGNLTSFIRLASPMPTIWRFLKKKSVEEFTFHPYVAGIMICILWVFYSMPFVHPHSIPVTTVNCIGLFLNVVYVIVYWIYTVNSKRNEIKECLSAELGVLLFLASVTLLAFHNQTTRSNFLGVFCDIFGIVFYGAPLTAMWNVIKTKSVEFMPLSISLTGFANGIVWSAYGVLRFDPYILISNAFGAILGALQLILYVVYSRSKPKDAPNPTPQIQLSTGTKSLATAAV